MQPILALIRKQFLEIRSSAQLRALTLIAPIFQLLLFGFAASLDVKDISLAVYDADHSSQSRELVGHFVNSGYFRVVQYLNRYDDADETLLDGHAKMVLVIPPNFSDGLLAGRSVSVQGLFD